MRKLIDNRRRSWLKAALLAVVLSLTAATSGAKDSRAAGDVEPRTQENPFPAPPADRTLIYFADETNRLTPLTFEVGVTPMRVDEVARGDKRSYVEIKGERATTVIADDAPRFYLFVPDEKNVHTPFLVRLVNKGRARRVTAMAQRGQRGFAIDSEEIIMPHYRVLTSDGGMLYMEFRARQPLPAGEYAFIGADLQRIATFRIGGRAPAR
jgi:lipoprotein-anchoring transpeptidase ErfK/SrfK